MEKLPVKVPFSGFYESTHDAMFDSWLDYEQDTLMTEHNCTLEQVRELADLFYSEINWKAAHTSYAKAYCSELEKLMEDASRKYELDKDGNRYLTAGRKIALEFIELTSPREYNFATDCIYANISLDDLRHMLWVTDDAAWREFVKEKCTSYDGFISFYSPDFSKWETALKEWGEARLGMLLEFYIMHILKDETTSNINDALCGYTLLEDYSGNGYIDNWIYENASDKFKTFADSLRKD